MIPVINAIFCILYSFPFFLYLHIYVCYVSTHIVNGIRNFVSGQKHTLFPGEVPSAYRPRIYAAMASCQSANIKSVVIFNI